MKDNENAGSWEERLRDFLDPSVTVRVLVAIWAVTMVVAALGFLGLALAGDKTWGAAVFELLLALGLTTPFIVFIVMRERRRRDGKN